MKKLLLSLLPLVVSGSLFASTDLMLVNNDSASRNMSVTYKICAVNTSYSIDCANVTTKTVEIPGKMIAGSKNYLNIATPNKNQTLVVTNVKVNFGDQKPEVQGTFGEEKTFTRTCYNLNSAEDPSSAIILDTLNTNKVFCNSNNVISNN